MKLPNLPDLPDLNEKEVSKPESSVNLNSMLDYPDFYMDDEPDFYIDEQPQKPEPKELKPKLKPRPSGLAPTSEQRKPKETKVETKSKVVNEAGVEGKSRIPKSEYDEKGTPILNIDIDDTNLLGELDKYFD